MSSSTMSKRTMAIGVIAAFAMAIVISMAMASPAMAAQKKPYKGYQDQDTITIYDAQGNKTGEDVYTATYGAGTISMESVGDTRKVKPGFKDFIVWSGNYQKRYLNFWTDNDADKYTIVDNVSQFKKLKGMSYNAKKNTLTLKNVKASQYVLNVKGMGTGFKIVLKGKNQLAGINIKATETGSIIQRPGKSYKSEIGTGFYPSCVKIDGTGSLAINKKKYLPNSDNASFFYVYSHYSSPVMIDGGGQYEAYNAAKDEFESAYAYTKSKIAVTKKAKVQIYAYGAANVVSAVDSAAKKPVSIAGLKKGVLNATSVKIAASKKYERDDVDLTEADGTKAYDEYCYKLNDGAFYAYPDMKGAWYYDTKARAYYFASWKIYQTTKPAQTIVDEDGYSYTTDAEATFLQVVGNAGDHPAGYTPVVKGVDKAHYSYVIKNSKLVAGK